MDRRTFVASGVATGLILPGASVVAQTPTSPNQEFYLLRRYSLHSGAGAKVVQTYFADALVPAMHRMNIGPVGLFSVEYGPDVPEYWVLATSAMAEPLLMLDWKLRDDREFQAKAAPFWSAPAGSPVFDRVESSLHRAFVQWPRITPPARGSKWIYQMRTYEGPSFADHFGKLEMMNSGEAGIFARAGAQSVFYGETLIGPRQPSLTYMLAFPSVDKLNEVWTAFRDDPEWKKLTVRFATGAVVSRIANVILTALPGSEV